MQSWPSPLSPKLSQITSVFSTGMPPCCSSRSASSSSSKAPTTPPLIIVPFTTRQTRSSARRAIVVACEARSSPENHHTLNIPVVSVDFNGLMEDIDAYVDVEEYQSNLNENSADNLNDEVVDFPENRHIALENLRTQDPGYTPSPPTDHRAAALVSGVQSVSTQK